MRYNLRTVNSSIRTAGIWISRSVRNSTDRNHSLTVRYGAGVLDNPQSFHEPTVFPQDAQMWCHLPSFAATEVGL